MLINKKILKSLLTTASTLAIISFSIDSAFATDQPEFRTTTQENVTLGTGGGLDNEKEFINDSTLQIETNAPTTIISIRNIKAIDVNNNEGANLRIADNITLGSVVDTSAGGDKKLKVVITPEKTLILTGSGSNNLGFIANNNDYTALGDIEFFDQGASALTIRSKDEGAITLAGKFINGNKGTLNVETNLAVKDVSAAKINKINITNAKALTFDVGNQDLEVFNDGARINFKGKDSTVIFKVNAQGGKAINFYDNFAQAVAEDDVGKVEFHNNAAAENQNILTVGLQSFTLGNDRDNRLQQLKTAGTGAIKFDGGSIFAKSILIDGTGAVEFVNHVNSGENSELKFNQDGEVTFKAGASITTIDFNATKSVLNAGGEIAGNVDSTAGANGTLNFTGTGGVTGTIGATNPLALVNFNAEGEAITLGGTARANRFIFKTADKVTANGDITGDIDFANQAGEINAKNITICGNVDSKGGANGTLNFTGTGGVTGNIGANNALREINIQNGAEVSLTNAQVKAKTITIGDNHGSATLIRGGEVDFDLQLHNKRKIVFAHQDSILKLQSTAGKRTVTLLNNFHTNNENKGVVELHASSDSCELVIVGSKGVKKLGTNENKLKELRVTGQGVVTINGGDRAVDLTNVNKLNIKAQAQLVAKTNTVGKIKTINIGEGSEGAGTLTIYATDGNVDLMPGDKNKINFKHEDSHLKLVSGHNDERTFTISNNFIGIQSKDHIGKVELDADQGKLTIAGKLANNNLGFSENRRLKELIISGNQPLIIETKVYAKNLTLDNTNGPVNFAAGLIQGENGIINVKKDVTLTGDITGTNTNINLGKQVLTYNSKANFDGNVIINTEIKAGGNGIGHIVVDGTEGKLDLTAADKVTVIVMGISDQADIGQSYKLFDTKNGGVVSVNNQPNLINRDTNLLWSYDSNNISNPPPADGSAQASSSGTSDPNPGSTPSTIISKKLIQYFNQDDKYIKLEPGSGIRLDDSAQGLQKDFGQTNPGIVEAFAGVRLDDNNDAASIVELFRVLQKDPVRQKEAAERLSVIASTEHLAAFNNEVAQFAQSSIGTRIDNLSKSSNLTAIKLSEASPLGVAAGDEMTVASHGIWASPFYSQATQQKKNNIPGYKRKSLGGTTGFDCLVNENLTLGAALTIGRSKFKHKDQKLGDRTKAESTLFSIYGLQQLPNNWFVQAIVSFGSSKVHNNEKRVVSRTLDQIASANYTSTTYSGEILAGHRYIMPETNNILTPMVGLNYAKFNDSGYMETGTNKRNLNVRKKSIDRLEGILGMRAALLSQLQEVIFIAEIHGFMNYNLKGKALRVDARLNGALAPMPSRTSKAAKILYNLGTSLTIKHHMMEYGFGYNANLAKKYIAHQGTVKVRVNF